MADVKWKRGASNPVSLITTGLDSLTSTGTATSAAQDNSTDGFLYMDLELLITYGTNPTAGSVIECYVVASVDGGTNYEDTPPLSGYVGAFVLSATTSAQRRIIRGVQVPPENYKVHLVAKTTGQTAASSGNTLRGLYYTEQVV